MIYEIEYEMGSGKGHSFISDAIDLYLADDCVNSTVP